jgi:hypothetical protein
MTTTVFSYALLTLAMVTGSAPVTATPPKSTIRWEYRTLTKDQLLNLGKTDLAAALNRLGEDGWELAAVDGVYIFKRLRGPVYRRAEDIRDDIKILEAQVEQQKDRVAWAERMGKKGFLATTQIQFERDWLQRLELALARARRELDRLPEESRETVPPPHPVEKPNR